jgi:hypothetical protein
MLNEDILKTGQKETLAFCVAQFKQPVHSLSLGYSALG